LAPSPFAGLRAALFDLDGTVVDTLDDLAGSVNFALARLGRPARSRDEIRGFIGEGVRQLIRDALGPAHAALTDEGLGYFTPHYLEHCTDKSVLYPGVKETLARLSGFGLAMVTNKPEAPSRRILEALGVADGFKVLIGGDTLAVKKPDPAPVREACARLGVTPAQAVMVGDSPGDMAAARAAGARTLAVSFGYRPAAELEAAGAQAVARAFSDVAVLLEA
jgi:phosphoglycolate phosphatase